MKYLLIPLTLCIHLFAHTLAAKSEIPAGIEHVQTLDGIEEYKLTANGLRILLMPNDAIPVASVMVTYQVGSRNEVTGTTGATHILEHMMFKGTERFNSQDGTDYSSQMERIGARSNATTYFDRTNYYAVLPSEYVDLAIELEADRMRNLRITEADLASEMTVVRNEYERGENNPVRTLIKEIYAAAFVAQPYGHPTIGWLSDIESTSPEKLRTFYDTYYWPENTYLSVIGGFDKTATLESILKYYSSIPNSPNPIPTVETIEPEQLGPRRVNLERAGQVGVVSIAYKVPEGIHEDWAALNLIDQIIGADKTGRLYRALEDQGKASATFTFAPQLRDPSLFFFFAYLTPEATHAETEAIMLAEIERVIQQGITADELERAKSVVLANTVYGRDGPFAISSVLNEAIAMNDWTSYVKLPKAMQKITPGDIQQVAKKYFTQRTSTTGWFVPTKENATLTAFKHSTSGPNYFRDPEVFGPEHKTAQSSTQQGILPPQSRINFADFTQTAKIGDIELIAVDMPIEQVVSFTGSLAAGDIHSPEENPFLATLTASMLEKGTQKNDRFAIAERLDKLGAAINFSSGTHNLQFSGKFLSQDAGLIMTLLAEQLQEPAFDPALLENLKKRQKAALLQASENTDYLADAALSRALYPANHPNYNYPISELIQMLEDTTIEQIQDFHQQHYSPRQMRIVFAGDINFQQLKAAVATTFESWPSKSKAALQENAQKDNAHAQQTIEVADKASVSVRYGYNTGLRRTDEDYLAFMLGNYILGGSFHSRLMTEVRKNQGLTYSIRSGHTGDILTPGHWKLSASFAPAMLAQGLTATDQVIKDWYTQGVTSEEVAKAIQALSGGYLVGLSTTGAVAGQLNSFMERGLPFDYIDEYPQRLQTITAQQVNQAIRKYFNLDQINKVFAGSLSSANSPANGSNEPPTKISIQLDTPDAGWQIQIQSVYQTGDELHVLAQLKRTKGMAAQTISSVSDRILLPSSLNTENISYYIAGKTWNWGGDNYQYVESLETVAQDLENAELIYQAP